MECEVTVNRHDMYISFYISDGRGMGHPRCLRIFTQAVTQVETLCVLRVSMRGVAHPRGEIATALTCVLQGFCQLILIAARRLYDQLYDRRWFAGCKTYARHVPLRVAPAGLRDRDRQSITEGCFPAI